MTYREPHTIDIYQDLTDDTQLAFFAKDDYRPLIYLVCCDRRMRDDYVLPIDLPKELLRMIAEYVMNTDQVIYKIDTRTICQRGSLTGHLLIKYSEGDDWYDCGLFNFPQTIT
jgi:hypothetical protein